MTIQVEQIQQTITETIRAEMAELHRFVDRRIAELSMEIHATVDLLDFSENNLSGQLRTIREEIAGIAGQSVTTQSTGLELEAVVQATEAAANRIMEAAEAIGEWLQSGSSDPAAMAAVSERVNAIFEACSFQDLTGQRIRKAIQHLQQVETMLTHMVPAEPEDEKPPAPQPRHTGGALGQDAVDSLFG